MGHWSRSRSQLPRPKRLSATSPGEHGPGLGLERREHPEVDWTIAWREGLGVRRIGRFAIVPTWISYAPAPDEQVSSSTRRWRLAAVSTAPLGVALELLDRFTRPGDRVLDLGSGSGILTIAAAKLGATQAAGIEVDAESLPFAAQNAERNGVTDRVGLP